MVLLTATLKSFGRTVLIVAECAVLRVGVCSCILCGQQYMLCCTMLHMYLATEGRF